MYHLAQVNVARMRGAPDSAVMGEFMAAADPVFRMAEASPGFVWRLRSGGGHVPVSRPDGSGFLVVNLSVWESYEALHLFVYRGGHGGLIRRRAEWFVPGQQPSTALWWVPAGERPTVEEALRRLAVLRRYGPSARAFSLLRRFEPGGQPSGRAALSGRAARIGLAARMGLAPPSRRAETARPANYGRR